MPKPAILIVDDIEDNRQGLVDWLEDQYECLLAADSDQADTLLAERLPQLILLDLSLPGRSGWDFAKDLKGDARTKGVPIVAVSAFAGVADRERALAVGCDDFLSKPFRMAQMMKMIEKYLD